MITAEELRDAADFLEGLRTGNLASLFTAEEQRKLSETARALGMAAYIKRENEPLEKILAEVQSLRAIFQPLQKGQDAEDRKRPPEQVAEEAEDLALYLTSLADDYADVENLILTADDVASLHRAAAFMREAYPR